MKTQTVPPTGIAQRFEVNETFFSTTNLKGQITAGNEVFSRTSAYPLEELIGSPHNLIRHPDMPRCVFDLLWKEALQKRPFSGYVKNQAKNGNHYWVFALIEPIGGELLSVRIKPTSKLLSQVEKIYAELLTIENEAIANGTKPANAIALSTSRLNHATSQLGFKTYAHFSHYCLNQEIKERDKLIANQSLRIIPGLSENQNQSSLSDSYRNALLAYKKLQSVFVNLDDVLSMADEIKRESLAVREIATHFRHYALNANIAATPLGHKGATIGTITQFLHAHSEGFSNNSSTLIEHINGTTEAVTSIVSRLASARIQLEMLITFIVELANKGSQAQEKEANDILLKSFSSTLTQAAATFQELEKWLTPLKRKKDELLRSIVSFNVAQITGLMECSRIPEATELASMFADFRTRIESAKRELTNSNDIIKKLDRLAETTPSQIRQVIENLQISKHQGKQITPNKSPLRSRLKQPLSTTVI